MTIVGSLTRDLSCQDRKGCHHGLRSTRVRRGSDKIREKMCSYLSVWLSDSISMDNPSYCCSAHVLNQPTSTSTAASLPGTWEQIWMCPHSEHSVTPSLPLMAFTAFWAPAASAGINSPGMMAVFWECHRRSHRKSYIEVGKWAQRGSRHREVMVVPLIRYSENNCVRYIGKHLAGY